MTDVATAPQIVHDTFPVRLSIDGREVRFAIKRLDFGEWGKFEREFIRSGRAHNKRAARIDRARRRVESLTGEMRLETDNEVIARLDDEETAEARASRETQEAKELDENLDFVTRSISAFVSCDAGQLSSNDKPIRGGEDILKYYGAREDVIGRLIQEIYTQNAFSEEKKRELASLPALFSSSNVLSPKAVGDALALIAALASGKASASPETATASPETPSGPTGPTS